uniref:Uncharacterized protein n=1 Tax=Rangifer tarandus platyrhynchus TaxID=3082113 RepID=A0ACB0EF36_RANTA|nr:unnamed protein product [Rangifer tarandus platyrhynchus]
MVCRLEQSGQGRGGGASPPRASPCTASRVIKGRASRSPPRESEVRARGAKRDFPLLANTRRRHGASGALSVAAVKARLTEYRFIRRGGARQLRQIGPPARGSGRLGDPTNKKRVAECLPVPGGMASARGTK